MSYGLPDLPRFQSGADAWSNPVHLPRGTGCGIRLRTDRPTHPAWEAGCQLPQQGQLKLWVGHWMAQPRSPVIAIAFKANSFMYLKTLAVLTRPPLQVLQPLRVGGDARVVHRYAFPADLLQFSAYEHGPMVTWRTGSCPAGEIPPQTPHIRFPQKYPPVPLGWPCPSLGQSSPSQESRYHLG